MRYYLTLLAVISSIGCNDTLDSTKEKQTVTDSEQMKGLNINNLSEDPDLKGFYTGSVHLGPRTIIIYLSTSGSTLDEAKSVAVNTLHNIDRIETAALKEASKDLLDTYNDSWREYKESDGNGIWKTVSNPILKARDFESKLRLRSIYVEGKSSLSIRFSDGDLFSGHEVEVISFDGIKFTNLSVSLSG